MLVVAKVYLSVHIYHSKELMTIIFLAHSLQTRLRHRRFVSLFIIISHLLFVCLLIVCMFINCLYVYLLFPCLFIFCYIYNLYIISMVKFASFIIALYLRAF